VCFFSFGLGQHKPIGPKAEGIAGWWLCWFFLRPVCVGCPLEWHRHAKSDAAFSLAYLPFAFDLTAIGVERFWLQIASNTLFESKQRIPETVIVKCGVGCEDPARLLNRFVQELSPSGMLFFVHLFSSRFFFLSSVVFA
jgi:hypothetical protein